MAANRLFDTKLLLGLHHVEKQPSLDTAEVANAAAFFLLQHGTSIGNACRNRIFFLDRGSIDCFLDRFGAIHFDFLPRVASVILVVRFLDNVHGFVFS